MTTITVPLTTYADGTRDPDLTGLDGHLGYTLNADGETYTVTMPPGWRAPGTLTRLEFARRLTLEERIAIRASADPVVADIMHLVDLAQEIRLDDADTIAGVEYLERAGLLAPGRAREILAP